MNTEPQYKHCSKCRILKGHAEFYKRSQSKDGLTPICKSCQAEKAAAYYKKNKGRVLLACRDYYQRNSEAKRGAAKSYASRNKQKVSLAGRLWREKNKESIKLKRLKRRRENIESIREQERTRSAKRRLSAERITYMAEYNKRPKVILSKRIGNRIREARMRKAKKSAIGFLQLINAVNQLITK